MGLSNNPKDALTTLQVLIELMQGVSTLVNDPKALEKAAKDAYALPDAEQKKADAARATIAELDAATAKQRQSQTELEAAADDQDKRKAAADEAAGKLAVKGEDLRSKEAQLKADKAEHAKQVKLLEQREQALVNDAAILDDRKAKLDAREAAIADQESVMKAKIKVLTEGL